MPKVLDYIIEIRDRGEKIPVAVKIDFVSNWCVREYNDIFTDASKVRMLWAAISDATTEIAGLKIEKPEGYKDKITTLKEKSKSATDEILKVGNSDFIKRRFELLTKLLTDNGVTEERLLNFKTWDEQIDPAQAMAFLSEAIYKDIDKKKIQ